MKHDLVIFDMDGTLITPKSGNRYKQTPDDWVLISPIASVVRNLIASGVTVGIATNQGGVAFGYHTERDVQVELEKVCELLGIDPKLAKVCYEHPDASINHYRRVTLDRKPGPGMLLALMHETQTPPQSTLMVGDRDEDAQAAKAAGVEFIEAAALARNAALVISA